MGNSPRIVSARGGSEPGSSHLPTPHAGRGERGVARGPRTPSDVRSAQDPRVARSARSNPLVTESERSVRTRDWDWWYLSSSGCSARSRPRPASPLREIGGCSGTASIASASPTMNHRTKHGVRSLRPPGGSRPPVVAPKSYPCRSTRRVFSSASSAQRARSQSAAGPSASPHAPSGFRAAISPSTQRPSSASARAQCPGPVARRSSGKPSCARAASQRPW